MRSAPQTSSVFLAADSDRGWNCCGRHHIRCDRRNAMKLSDGERLIVVMLADVMQAMGLNHEIDPTLVKRLAVNHDDWAIASRYHGIFDGEGPSDAEVSETHEILSMWSWIEHSISQLEGAEAEEAANFHHSQFSGFDGNNDPHFGIAHTMINDLGYYDEFADRNLNSHSRATLERYRRMLPQYKAAMDRHAGQELTLA